jgi:hypothetical protein
VKKKETKREKRLRQKSSQKQWQASYNEVLLSEDPEIWIDYEQLGFEQSLGMALEEFFQYIRACYFLDSNPLSHLRKYCPGFTWRFYEDVPDEKIANILGCVDYIWMGLGHNSFVTATQVGRKNPRILCYRPKSGECYEADKLKRVLPTVRFVINGDEETADTIVR